MRLNLSSLVAYAVEYAWEHTAQPHQVFACLASAYHHCHSRDDERQTHHVARGEGLAEDEHAEDDGCHGLQRSQYGGGRRANALDGSRGAEEGDGSVAGALSKTGSVAGGWSQTGGIAGRRVQTDFVAFFEEYGESRRTGKTQDSYAYAAKVLREYCEARRLWSLTFMDIDYSRLVDFSRWLESTGRSHATRHMLESYVRAAYRDAQKRRLVSSVRMCL